MNDKFDELAKGLAKLLTSVVLCLAVAAQFGLPVRANDLPVGQLIDLSDPDPFLGCPGGFPAAFDDMEGEPNVAVNPANPLNIVAVWIGGGAKGIVAGVTLDGGNRWRRVAIPGLSICSGGTGYGFNFDPWISFAPNGDIQVVCGATDGSSTVAMLATRSSDGGLHWSSPFVLAFANDSRFFPDHPSVTADPVNAHFAYAMWDGSSLGHRGPAIFSRTTDGGVTWEPGRILVQTSPQDYVQFSQILVLPDGTLVAAYELVNVQNSGQGIQESFSLQVVRSGDRGQTWSNPTQPTTMLPLYGGPNGNSLVTDPDTGHLVQDPINPSFAVDSRSGSLYAVWEDARFNNFQYNDIAFSMSVDGGLTWSTPIRVNQTPLNIAPANRQAFLPSVAVAADGTIAVTYYDFRFNDANPGVPTDYWLARCQPSSTTPATNPASWGSEVRLTAASFNLEQAPNPFGKGYFIGDYEGLAGAGTSFVATWSQPNGTDPDSVFFRRVGP